MTIDETAKYIRKLEACDGFSAKLIVMRQFMEQVLSEAHAPATPARPLTPPWQEKIDRIRKTVDIARKAYPHSDKWLNMYADDVEDMMRLIDSMIRGGEAPATPAIPEELREVLQTMRASHTRSLSSGTGKITICDCNGCKTALKYLVAEAAPTMPTWLHELQDFTKEFTHASYARCYESEGQDERDPDKCQKCYLEKIIREIPGQGRKP